MRFVATLFLMFLVGCNGCASRKTAQTVQVPATTAMVGIESEAKAKPVPLPAPAPAPIVDHNKLGEEPVTATIGDKPKAKKVKKAKKVSKVAPDTSLNVQHPDHFYSKVWGKVSITLGQPIPDTKGVIEITDSVPTAAAYSITLRGEPTDQFEIKQGEQVVSAPRSQFPSSTVYFDVKPLNPGHKKLIYQVKARLSVDDPGIGLPEVTKDILVEVSRQSFFAWIKGLSSYLMAFLGAVGSAVGAWIIKKWFAKKNFSDNDEDDD